MSYLFPAEWHNYVEYSDSDLLAQINVGDTYPLKNRKKQKSMLTCDIAPKLNFLNNYFTFFNTYITIVSLFNVIFFLILYRKIIRKKDFN